MNKSNKASAPILSDKQVNLLVAATISVISSILAVVHLFVPGSKIDPIGLALIFIAILPWLMPYLQRHFRSIELFGSKIEFLQTKVDEQQRIINELVIYSMSTILFKILSNLYHGEEYIYHADEGTKRQLRFLREHGYLHHFGFDSLHDGQNLVGTLRLTPAGELLVQERESLRNIA